MSESDRIFELIEQRRKELGLSQAQVSERAFDRSDTSAIQNIRRGSSPSVDKLAALGEALGLEFYFGPKRAEVVKTAQAISEQFAPALETSRQAMANLGFAEEPVHFQAQISATVSSLTADMPGWAEPKQTGLLYPLPEGADDQAAEYLQLEGGGCAARGVPPDATLLIDASQPVGLGDVALLTDRGGNQIVRRITDEAGGWVTTTGYQFDHDAWVSFTDKWKGSAISARAKVVAAFARTPSADETQINLLAAPPAPAAGQHVPIGRTASGQPVLFASADWLHGDVEALDTVTVPDAAMEPLLRAGATVIIQTDAALDDGAIVATLTAGKIGLHRFRREPNGGAFFWHDNPAHPPLSAPAGSTEIHIMGRAVWVGFWLE